VQDLNRSGDERVYGMIFDHAEGGHPVAAVHQQMADQLVAFIQETLPEVASR
jgi:phospholipase/lecithinase/hemolysin